MKKILIAVFLLLMPAVAFGATTTVTLEWDANTESDLAGYRIYEGMAENGAFSQVQELGTVTTTMVWNVADGNHCWKMTAFDTSNNESPFSNTVCLQTDASPPSAPQAFRATGVVVVP